MQQANQTTQKKAYMTPEIAEIGRLDRFVNAHYNAAYNDGQKYILPKGYVVLEKSQLS